MTFQVTNSNDSGPGSLRQAILDANANAGPDSISFALAGSKSIAPTSPLPHINGSVIVDATTQPGWLFKPIVELNGSNAGEDYGLRIYNGTTTIRGLVINRFALGGIYVGEGATGSKIQANYIGTDFNGTVDHGNGGDGIRIGEADLVAIGGSLAAERNIISGNAGYGILIYDGSTGNTVANNRVGTNPAGTAALPNDAGGIRAETNNSDIGLPNAGNLVSGNGGIGVGVDGHSNRVRGNTIGLNANGTAALGNAGRGMWLDGSLNAVGGINVSDGNVIAGNAGTGVMVSATASNNELRRNRIGTNAAGTAALGNADGMRVFGSQTTVAGNLVSGNTGVGVSLEEPADGCSVVDNTIGLNLAGNAKLANSGTGLRVGYGSHVIGAGNVISGNGSFGIYVDPEAAQTQIVGNRIGTNAAGTSGLGNASSGVRVFGSDVLIESNLVSGNGSGGVSLEEPADGCSVVDNTIGLNLAGTAKLGNSGTGLRVGFGSHVIGAGNVISGNGSFGIYVDPEAEQTQIIGNRIGTNAAGTSGLGNTSTGVRVFASDVLIDGNLISGNGFDGVSLEDESTGCTVTNNTIGLNLAGTVAVTNNGSGIVISSVGGHTIGMPGQGNVVSSNQYNGFLLWKGTSGNVIRANKIGTGPDGQTAFGNSQLGIRIILGFDNTIGGTGPGEGNIIFYNGLYGVMVEHGWGNPIVGNSMYKNAYWGIDLAPYGPDLNDPGDGDFGPNRGQNHPVLLAAAPAGSDLSVNGELRSAPLSTFRVEVFGNNECDPSGAGEGRTFLGAVDVTTNASGVGTYSTTFPGSGAQPFVTATATDLATNDTSEFSPCIAAIGPNPGMFQFSQDQYVAYEWEADGVVTVTVVRSGGTAGTASVSYATGAGGAQAGVDYTPVAGTLTFAPGEVMKTFDIPITFDLVIEGQENVPIVLSNPTGGATLGAQSTGKIAIIDYDPAVPTTLVSDAAIVEGTGGNKNAVFTITVPATTVPVTVDYYTEDGTAHQGVDYVETIGEVTFQPGDGPKTVNVPVIGDADQEDTESFYLQLYPSTGTLTDGTGEGLIEDDDGGTPTPTWTPTWTPTNTSVPTNTPTPTNTPGSGSPTPQSGDGEISGHVFYYSNVQPVGDVMVKLNGAPIAQTDDNGGYAVGGLNAGNWTASPAKLGSAKTCVSSLDASYVLQAVVGLINLSDEQRLAGDVTGNGTLSSLDAARILQYKVGLINELPVAATCGSDWAFLPVPVSIPGQSTVSPQMSPGTCTMGSVLYDPLSGQAGNQDYLAVAFGDVSGNWQPGQSVVQGGGGAALSKTRHAAAAVQLAKPRARASGKLEVPVRVESDDGYRSLDMEIRYDPEQVRPVRVRKLRAARGVMVVSNVKEDGRVLVSLASREPLDSKAGAPVAVVFEAPYRRLSSDSIRLRRGEVDGQEVVADPSDD